jgi:hypothetical protein
MITEIITDKSILKRVLGHWKYGGIQCMVSN